MKKSTITFISFIVMITSLIGLAFLPKMKGYAVKYVITENGPKFRTFERELYDVQEYEEGHYYFVDDDGKFFEGNLQEWTRNRLYCGFILIVKLAFLFSTLITFGFGIFYYNIKRITTKNNYLSS